MVDRSNQFEKPNSAAAIGIFAPKWYLDIVSARLHSRDIKSRNDKAMVSVYNLTKLSLGDDTTPHSCLDLTGREKCNFLLPLLEILQPHCLESSPSR